MKKLKEIQRKNDELVAKNIEKYGCHIVSVFDPKEVEPIFSYSIGIEKVSAAPEAIVLGAQPKLAQYLINTYSDRVKAGEKFVRGVLHSGFLEGFGVLIEPVKPVRFKDYTFGCDRVYQELPYRVVQIVFPSTTGVWPWEAKASEWFKTNQPMLGRKRPDKA